MLSDHPWLSMAMKSTLHYSMTSLFIQTLIPKYCSLRCLVGFNGECGKHRFYYSDPVMGCCPDSYWVRDILHQPRFWRHRNLHTILTYYHSYRA